MLPPPPLSLWYVLHIGKWVQKFLQHGLFRYKMEYGISQFWNGNRCSFGSNTHWALSKKKKKKNHPNPPSPCFDNKMSPNNYKPSSQQWFVFGFWGGLVWFLCLIMSKCPSCFQIARSLYKEPHLHYFFFTCLFITRGVIIMFLVKMKVIKMPCDSRKRAS